MTLVLKRGDLLPPLEAVLTDDGVPVDLTSATSIRAVGVRRGVTLFDRAVSGDAQGLVTVDWQAGDTDLLGYFNVEFRVTWPGTLPQTFPPDGSTRVRVTLDNG